MSNNCTKEYKKGRVFIGEEDDMFTAQIDTHGWTGKVLLFAESKKEANEFQDKVIDLLNGEIVEKEDAKDDFLIGQRVIFRGSIVKLTDVLPTKVRAGDTWLDKSSVKPLPSGQL
jgi:hypothetical protein